MKTIWEKEVKSNWSKSGMACIRKVKYSDGSIFYRISKSKKRTSWYGPFTKYHHALSFAKNGHYWEVIKV